MTLKLDDPVVLNSGLYTLNGAFLGATTVDTFSTGSWSTDWSLTSFSTTGNALPPTVTGGVGRLTWSSGSARAGVTFAASNVNPTPTNTEVYTIVNTVNGGSYAHAHRMASPDNGYQVTGLVGIPAKLQINRVIAGTVVTLGTKTVTGLIFPFHLKTQCLSDTIRFKAWNINAAEPTWTSTTNTLSVTDAAFTSGKAGAGTYDIWQTGFFVEYRDVVVRELIYPFVDRYTTLS